MCHGTAQLPKALKRNRCSEKQAHGSGWAIDDASFAKGLRPGCKAFRVHAQEGGDAQAYVSEPLVSADMDVPAAAKRASLTAR